MNHCGFWEHVLFLVVEVKGAELPVLVEVSGRCVRSTMTHV